MQTRILSLVETTLSTFAGFLVALATQIIIFPWFGIYIEISQDILIVLIFTGSSIARGYGMRRLFNFLERKEFISRAS